MKFNERKKESQSCILYNNGNLLSEIKEGAYLIKPKFTLNKSTTHFNISMQYEFVMNIHASLNRVLLEHQCMHF